MSDLFRKYKSLYSSTSNTFSTGEDVTITPASVVGLPTDTEITLTFDRVDSSGNKTPDKMERIRGTVTGSNFVISSGGRAVEGTEQVHTSPVVEMVWNADDLNDIVDGILVEHDQDGTHKAQDSLDILGTAVDTDTSLTANSDSKVATQKAVKAYADTKSDSSKTETFTNKTLTSPVFQGTVDGWISANETWTYASADDPSFTFTIAGVDLTTKYSAGMRIKLTQTTVKYFIITAVAFSTNTTITVYGGTDYDLADATITSPYYSTQKAPVGFPVSPAKWTVSATDTTARSQGSVSAGTWYNLGSVTISIPIGVWNTDYIVQAGWQNTSAAVDFSLFTTLSTANNSESSSLWTCKYAGRDANNARFFFLNLYKTNVLTLTSKTSYYLNTKSGDVTTTLYNANDVVPLLIRAVCSYL